MGVFVLNLVVRDLRNRDMKQCECTLARALSSHVSGWCVLLEGCHCSLCSDVSRPPCVCYLGRVQ